MCGVMKIDTKVVADTRDVRPSEDHNGKEGVS